MPEYPHVAETFDNGLRLVWLDLPHLHSVALCAYVLAGPVYGNRQTSGVSHLLEHLHMAVTRRHPTRAALLQALDALAGTRRARTSTDALVFEFSVPPTELGHAAELLADVLESRDFPEEVVAAEKRLLSSELEATQGADSRYLGRLFGDHPFGLWGSRGRAVLARSTTEEVVRFDRMSFRPVRIVVAVAGRIGADQLEQARRCLAAFRASGQEELTPPAPPTPPLPLFQTFTPRGATHRVWIGFVIQKPLTAEERVALRLVRRGLSAVSSPLWRRLRYEVGSTYQFRWDSRRLLGTRLLSVFGTPVRAHRDAFIRAVLQELADLRTGRWSAAWFETVRRQYQHAIETAKDSPSEIASRIAAEEARCGAEPLMSLDEELEFVGRLSVAAVAETASKLLTQKNIFVFADVGFRPFAVQRLRRLVASYL